MSSGFGKKAGPTPSSLSESPFGPPPPSFPHIPPRVSEAARSPPLIYQDPILATTPYQSTGIPRRPEAVERSRSPPSLPATTPSYPSIEPSFNQFPPSRNDASTVTSFVASRNSGTSVTAKVARFQDLKRVRSPTQHSIVEGIARNPTRNFIQSPSDFYVGSGNHSVPPITRSPTLAFGSNKTAKHVSHPFGEGQQPTLSPSAWDDQPKLPGNDPDLLAHQDLPVLSYAGYHDSIHASKRTRSPSVSPVTEVLQNNNLPVQKEYKRTSVSPPRLGSRSNAIFSASNSQIPQRNLPSVNATVDAAPIRNTSYAMSKRTRSPDFSLVDKVSLENSYSTQDDAEREIQAKAKRLARFKAELSDDFENIRDVADQKIIASGREQAIVGRKILYDGNSIESTGDLSNSNISPEFDGSETPTIIVGLCPDMCPESERAERERKGDLDHFERLDGNRNQTNKSLAVKKYNRTAEREANLIRPLPILQKTIDYLLDLLDQPYNDNFLGMYNFLWDRMRAIRMDLRMQHIFSQESLTMLEQMIRLHIIAMHELCEYKTGEGSIEGFDAHLNIEQMNKTSVELFQMYDDHRKKGINVPTEKEFRGYYALLKLDKHPGYKVEPAELSLDLAKMTSEIRQTSEVLFARNVARACRTGNFIAFFRLARKASYLQACLMHAHFAKLRTQALASLHCGLQNNQGLPVSLIAKWLAMEEVENLLEYHGFAIREFEEPYMVKDGLFLNVDKDYPTECSNLVHLKKSKRIVDDVSPPSRGVPLPAEAAKEIQPHMIYKHDTKSVPSAFVDAKSFASEIVEETPDFELVASPSIVAQVEPMIKEPIVKQQSQDDHQVASAYILPWGDSWAHSSPESRPAKFGVVEKPNYDTLLRVSPKRKMPSSMEEMSFPIVSRIGLLERCPSDNYGYTWEDSTSQIVDINESRDEEPFDINQASEIDKVMESNEDEEVARAKLKLIIRLWRRRSLKRRELREQRQMAANAALNSLSLGPPIRQATDQSITATVFDINHVMKERYEKHEQSWSRLNVSDEIADVLIRRNPDAKFLCWKIILCSQINDQGDRLGQRSQVMQGAAHSWVLSKLMPSIKDNDDGDLLISSPGLAIWRKWLPSQSGNDLNCCLSVVKDFKFDNLNETVDGASAVIFLVSESIPWNIQKIKLHNLLAYIPSGSKLPLLVLSGSNYKEDVDLSSIIVNELGLQDIDKSQISSFSIVFLNEDKQVEMWDGFFSDMRLREGLQWLANESPLQPDVHCIKTRDLVVTHLNPSLDVLEIMEDYEVSPNHCISAFNEALDRSLEEIAAAAKSNPTNWPCPEIALLENCRDELMVMNWYLPNIGWSLAERIEPFLSAIRDCKLPNFPDTIPWLDKGASTFNDIEDLRSQLENCIMAYLTEISGMMGFLLAAKEAYLMLQRSARLELHDSSYYIVPKWIMIFRRIFNWRLTSLSSGTFSPAFILRCHDVDLASRIPLDLQLEGGGFWPYPSQPTLDEVIDAGCSPIMSGRDQAHTETFQPLPRTISNGDVCKDTNTSDMVDNQETSAQNGNLFETENIGPVSNQLNSTGSTEIVFPSKVTKETDKLSKLLEQCSVVQNSIGEKLSIYF
ncbi:SAC3 family protein [Salix suchowensis]|nr:SAC3 family protein [Salix suchowensis]